MDHTSRIIEIIHIPPDTTAEDLIRDVVAEFDRERTPPAVLGKTTHFDSCLRRLVQTDLPFVSGKRLKACCQMFPETARDEEIRLWQRSRGCDGNVAALLVWAKEQRSLGWFHTLPNDEDQHNGLRPSFFQGGALCGFWDGGPGFAHSGDRVYVSFEEINT